MISGNKTWGVYITDSGTENNLVEGNYIGLNAAGTGGIANAYNGLDIVSGASFNTVGGTTAGARNVISGNAFNGVVIAFSGASNNLVEGNYIGVDVTGKHAVANCDDGLQIIGGATGNTVGGTTAGARNVISGNASAGVYISDSGTSGNLVEGNFIGTDSTGNAKLPNLYGVQVENSASYNTVGGTTAGARNVISGNGWDGIQLLNSSYSVVEGNYVGIGASGGSLGNTGSAVAIAQGATENTIGGTTAAASNVLSGNGGDGVYISDAGTMFNHVDNDYIGTDPTGEVAIPNQLDGVFIGNGATWNNIGVEYGNVISGNVDQGVELTGAGTNANYIQNNIIGVDNNMTKKLGNGADGVYIHGGASWDHVDSNLIGGNGASGVAIFDPSTTGIDVDYNIIGTNSFNTVNLGNGFAGVLLSDTTGNTVYSNSIYDNTDAGVRAQNGAAGQNDYANNYFGNNGDGNIDDDD